MARVQCVMLSGRYRTESLCSHWSNTSSKYCKTPACQDLNYVEDLPHILQVCSSLQLTRIKLLDFTAKYLSKVDILEVQRIIVNYCRQEHPLFCQILTDCSVLPDVIRAAQVYGADTVHGHLFHVTRMWCYCLHRDRLKLLGRWTSRKTS